ncbi:uncharacterized protein LOC107272196 isoform X2 [Cephus cinctus]|uniref:Uncharacterized protein LOC107272196 isoform X2 n=1 Tax=Cephus cinctus TaxID=211228 RepID=A0AAJ7RQH0_CEPCN|nr:uncharacterized protein LOC107272196 isoform X2 [Cephus cinctus]
MDEVTTMTVPPPLQAGKSPSQGARQTVSIRAVSPPSAPSEAGATVFVGISAPADPASTWRIPEVQSSNGYEAQSSQAAHVVKIKINPDENGKVISTVRLTLDEGTRNDNNNDISNESLTTRDGCVVVSATNVANSERSSEGCVRISVGSNEIEHHREDMVQRGTAETLNSSLNRSNACFYYGSFQNPLSAMVMSSGQCSPSDTLDSGTCSDLDGTPPPLPKKKSASTVILGTGQHNRTGSLTSSGAEVDSDDNESNISCDSLNSGELGIPSNLDHVADKDAHQGFHPVSRDQISGSKEPEPADDVREVSTNLECVTLNGRSAGYSSAEIDSNSCSTRGSPSVSPSPSGTSSLSKASTTPRVRSPDLIENKRLSPVVKECTYEERKREQERLEKEYAAADFYANYNRTNGNKYLYDDDRFYKFHLNEHRRDDEDKPKEPGLEEKEDGEYFAGYQILDREAIRSAKGTVRGVKNRVRAGIATFLQKPSSKNYKAKDAGKVVVYTTTMGIVRETYYACMKVKQILRTHMVKYEERDMFMSAESQTELRDRIGCTTIQVPQLFIDGQYIGFSTL